MFSGLDDQDSREMRDAEWSWSAVGDAAAIAIVLALTVIVLAGLLLAVLT